MIGKRDPFTKKELLFIVFLISLMVGTLFFAGYGLKSFYQNLTKDNNTPIINNITEIKPSSI